MSCLLLSTRDWMAGHVCSDQMASGWPGSWMQKNCELLALINQRLNDWLHAQWCSCCWTQKNCESLALFNQRLNDWPCVQWCGCCWTQKNCESLALINRRLNSWPRVQWSNAAVAQWCWTQKNCESLALINQRLNDWPCVQWCGCCWTVAYSYQPETEWLAVCAVIKLPAIARWCWTQKNRESLALINQRLNGWQRVQWSNGQAVVGVEHKRKELVGALLLVSSYRLT